jgi:hypothetical protein
MALTDTDRRRLIAATALTVLALPALWWANTSENSSAPNLAVAGLDADIDIDADADTDADSDIDGNRDGDDPITPPDASRTVPDALTRDVAPVFLDGPSSAAGAGQSEIAVPAPPLIDGITARATFRSSVSTNTCIVPRVTSGSRVTVVNLANNRSITCTSILPPGTSQGDVVLPKAAFAAIADLTDAPIAVEIRR